MSGAFHFAAAVVLLVAGHYLRMLRWKQFIIIYERPDPMHLLRSLAVGYIVNFFVFFRVGDLVRAVLAGRRFRNGVPFSLATIILEHFLDIPFVFTVFLSMALAWPKEAESGGVILLYGLLTLLVVILRVTAVVFSRRVKAVAKSFCGVFNQRIKFILLFFIWGVITVFKNVLRHSKKINLFLYTCGMWTFYTLSYFFLAGAIVAADVDTNFWQVFTLIFSNGGFSLTNQPEMFASSRRETLMIIAYIAASLVLLSGVSILPGLFGPARREGGPAAPERIQNLLPWVSEHDCLLFLESYYSVDRSDKLKSFIAANFGVHIIRDFSAGSKATVMLCMNESVIFYRKYALGRDGDKLYEQLRWLRTHGHVLPLPVVIHEQYNGEYCIYDMEYKASAMTFFNFIHSNSNERSWRILESAIDRLRETLHAVNPRPADRELTRRYIQDKVYGNIEKIESAKELRPLLEYDALVINGESYHNLKYLKQWLKKDFLLGIFADDAYSDIHGDFTLENLIYFEPGRDCPFYYIDPNPGNLHDSPALDYAKLLQSLHGGYEFLMYTDKVRVRRNEIQFVAAGSTRYADIYRKYLEYLQRHFSVRQIRSIYFHEVVHWLRLLPYKTEKDGPRAVLFFAGLIKVFNETVERFGAGLKG